MTVINRADLETAIRRRGGTIEPEAFMAVLLDIARSPDALTSGEADYLARHAGVTPTDSESEAQLRLFLNGVQDEDEVARKAYTTKEAATLLRTAPANIRRMVANRELITAGKRGASLLIPRWQLVNGRRLPHLAAILKVLPATMHPLDVEHLMTTLSDELGGRSPVDWLASGGPPDPVVWLAEGWART